MIFWVNSQPVISHKKNAFAISIFHTDFNQWIRLLSHEFDCIRYQILDDLDNSCKVTIDNRKTAPDLNLDLLRF